MLLANFLLQIQGFKFRMFHGLHNHQNYHLEVQLLSTLQQRLSFIIKRISHVQLQTLSFFLNSVVGLLCSHPDKHSPVSPYSRLLTCGLQCLYYSFPGSVLQFMDVCTLICKMQAPLISLAIRDYLR